MVNQKAFQEYYPDEMKCCYGCGTENEHGLKLKSYWDGDESVAEFTPRPYHTALPGVVYGGLIASLIDCHGTGTASAAAYKREGREMGSAPQLRFVTASLHVDYLAPTPIGAALELRGVVEEIKERKAVIDIRVTVEGAVCAKGRVIAVKMPERMAAELAG